MFANIEWLQRGQIGVIRAGPRCSRFGEPYDYAIVFKRAKYKTNQVTVKALVADGRFKTAHKKAIFAKLGLHFSNITWDRCKPWGLVKR